MSGTSLFGGNTRASATQRWLKKAPDKAHELVLRISDPDGGVPQTLQRWAHGDAVEDKTIGAQVEELIADYLGEVKGSCTALLQWVDSGQEVLQTRRLKARSETASQAEEFSHWEGNAQSVLAQTQAHQQVLMSHFADAMKYIVMTSAASQEKATEQRLATERELDRLRMENQELRDELQRSEAAHIIEQVTEAAKNADDPIAAQASGFLTMLAQQHFANAMKNGKAAPSEKPKPARGDDAEDPEGGA